MRHDGTGDLRVTIFILERKRRLYY